MIISFFRFRMATVLLLGILLLQIALDHNNAKAFFFQPSSPVINKSYFRTTTKTTSEAFTGTRFRPAITTRTSPTSTSKFNTSLNIVRKNDVDDNDIEYGNTNNNIINDDGSYSTINGNKKDKNKPFWFHKGFIQSTICTMIILTTILFSNTQSSFASSSNTNNDELKTMDIERKILLQQSSTTATEKTTSNNSNDDNNNLDASSSSTIQNNKSRYYTLLQSSNPNEIKQANEKLMDYAVGTINTMYYDNTGGASFSPKDMYDRWKILRVYAKEGIKGVEGLVDSNSDVVRRVSLNTAATDGKNDKESSSFQPQLFFIEDDQVKVQMNHYMTMTTSSSTTSTSTTKSNSKDSNQNNNNNNNNISIMPSNAFDSRENVITSLKWLVSTLDDPYSKYLTREELKQELEVQDDGFLGLGAIVEGPVGRRRSISGMNTSVSSTSSTSAAPTTQTKTSKTTKSNPNSKSTFLSLQQVSNLPSVTAIAPRSPAERAGIVVGDYIASIGNDSFLGSKSIQEVQTKLNVYLGADNYFGYPELTIAKPIYRASLIFDDEVEEDELNDYRDGFGGSSSSSSSRDQSSTTGGSRSSNYRRDEIMGYKLSRVRLTTTSLQADLGKGNSGESSLSSSSLMSEIVPSASAASTTVATTENNSKKSISGGDALVQWELLQPNDSIFRKYTSSSDNVQNNENNNKFRSSTDRVGYIRLTRFSRLSTAGYVNAIEELEKAGAQSYIIDVRNNYGGVIQESMLTASTLLRDPHTVLCYTLNSRGGFTPHDAEEYIIDTRYPGYLLSSESKDVTMEQVKRDSPNFVSGEGWIPPSSYASIREQRMNRGISRTSFNLFGENFKQWQKPTKELNQLRAQKKIVILMNEGTASAAEVFVSSLHDNGRTVATVGTKTYGKGLIQHTFPLQDGGGLRLSVAEYLTPALQHVTKVGNAQYDPNSGEYVGGGVKPDIFCPSTSGIASNVGADICVGMALDALEDADAREIEVAALTDFKQDDSQSIVGRRGGIDGGSGRRRTLTQGIVKDDF